MSVTSTDENLPIGAAPIFTDGDARDFFALLKPRVMSLVVFTALVGMLVAPGHINAAIGFIAILCIAIGGGASGALNMWYEADIDAVMARTSKRPIPAGRIDAPTVLAYGLTLAAFSVVTLGLATNWLAAGLLAFTIFFYAVVYTIWLKRSTPQNIVIGGAAGALPPVIGWAAVSGDVSIASVVLFLIIFLWTPAHFWALALFKSGDYGKAGIPMMPNVAGDASTKRQIVAYAVLTAVSAVLPAVLGFASLAYGAVAVVLGAAFVWYSVGVLRMPEGDQRMIPAKKMFGFSLLYLAIIFGALLVDALVPPLLAMVA
jgi:heme o synthase